MRYLKYLFLAAGAGLFAWVVSRADVAASVDQAMAVGWLGMALVLGLYFVAFLLDTWTWQLALVDVPLSLRWTYRAFKMRLLGETMNTITPAGGMGGEPVKAFLLKRYYGIGYRKGTASLLLSKTVNVIGVVLFLAGGFALMVQSAKMDATIRTVSGVALTALALGVAGFFLVQRFRITSRTGSWLSRWRPLRRLEGFLHHVNDMDDRLVHFYTERRWRFIAGIVLAVTNYLVGVAEVWVAMRFIGFPVTWGEAYIIEAATQLVRAAAFFVPAGLGVQEGAFLVACTAITGVPSSGIAAALVRRARQLLWLAWGALVGAIYSFSGGETAPRGD